MLYIHQKDIIHTIININTYRKISIPDRKLSVQLCIFECRMGNNLIESWSFCWVYLQHSLNQGHQPSLELLLSSQRLPSSPPLHNHPFHELPSQQPPVPLLQPAQATYLTQHRRIVLIGQQMLLIQSHLSHNHPQPPHIHTLPVLPHLQHHLGSLVALGPEVIGPQSLLLPLRQPKVEQLGPARSNQHVRRFNVPVHHSHRMDIPQRMRQHQHMPQRVLQSDRFYHLVQRYSRPELVNQSVG